MKKTQLAQKLSLIQENQLRKLSSFLIGFDGFTDEIVSAVDRRDSATQFSSMTTLESLASRIHDAAGKSSNIELISKQIKIGGNGPILAQALVHAGCAPTLIGCLGDTQIEPLFIPLTSRCKEVISLGASSHTDAIEFSDGKLMLGKHKSVLALTKERIQERIDRKTLIRLFNDHDVFVSVNWTMILSMTDIWRWLIEDILPEMTPKKRIVFVDLADPAKRSDADILEAVRVLQAMKPYYQVHLGLNERESERVVSLVSTESMDTKRQSIQNTAHTILQKTELDTIIIHSTKMAACSTQEESIAIEGPFCPTPYLSTGGGDNFNAGYLFGVCLGLSIEEALLLGKATSGYYVRVGNSPTLQELSQFLRIWDRKPQDLEKFVPKTHTATHLV